MKSKPSLSITGIINPIARATRKNNCAKLVVLSMVLINFEVTKLQNEIKPQGYQRLMPG